jgi:hypothetical protein
MKWFLESLWLPPPMARIVELGGRPEKRSNLAVADSQKINRDSDWEIDALRH